MCALTCVGMVVPLLLDRLMPFSVIPGMFANVGYGLCLVVLYRRRSHVLAGHMFLAVVSITLMLAMFLAQQLWLIAPLLITSVPFLSIQLLGRRAAVGWTVLIIVLLTGLIHAEHTGRWFTDPQSLTGGGLSDRIFIGLAMTLVMGILSWYYEGSRWRAESASSFKSAVLAGMSHELRTPLNGLLGILHDMSTQETTPSQERLAVVLRSGQSLLDIVDDALDLMQANYGGLHLEHEPFDLRAGLEEVLAHHRDHSSKTNVELRLDFPPGEPSWLTGDGRQIIRTIDKLIDNALKFTDEGHVRVTVRVTNERNEAEHDLSIRVSDTGIGIPEAKQSTIFEKFTQVEDSWDRTRGGTGLGLAVCRELVLAMRGQIGVTSVDKEGSEFWFSIPIEPTTPPPPAVEPEAGPSKTEGRGSIQALVVEDNPINQIVARRLLIRLGCVVDIANNGREGVDMIRRKPYDIVFMDIQMPVMDGFAATAHIRNSSDPRVASLPIVAVTAYTMARDRQRCFDAGMDGYVGKPIAPDRLAAELTRLTAVDSTPDPTRAPAVSPRV